MSYLHILVASDLSDECHCVMQRAEALAAASGAKLSLVHVIEPVTMAFGGDVPMDLSLLQKQQFEQAQERLDAFSARYSMLSVENRFIGGRQSRQAWAGSAARFDRQ